VDKQTFSGVADYAPFGTLADRAPACLALVGAPFLQTDVSPNQAFRCDRSGPADANFVWTNVTGGSAAAPGSSETIVVPLGLVTASSTTVLPAGALVTLASLNITTPYSVGATIEIGQAASPAAFMTPTGENDPQIVGLYQNPQASVANTPAQAVLVTIAGAPAAGAGSASITYVAAPQS
jgi:hypothetical protein